MQASILTHNGCITMLNTKTGNHRTVRIKTQPKDSDFLPGARILQLMIGSDNTRSFKGFGVIEEKGVRLWNKYRDDGFFAALARMIETPEKYEARGVIYQFETTCRVCNRLLTNPESIHTGIGPDCAARNL